MIALVTALFFAAVALLYHPATNEVMCVEDGKMEAANPLSDDLRSCPIPQNLNSHHGLSGDLDWLGLSHRLLEHHKAHARHLWLRTVVEHQDTAALSAVNRIVDKPGH